MRHISQMHQYLVWKKWHFNPISWTERMSMIFVMMYVEGGQRRGISWSVNLVDLWHRLHLSFTFLHYRYNPPNESHSRLFEERHIFTWLNSNRDACDIIHLFIPFQSLFYTLLYNFPLAGIMCQNNPAGFDTDLISSIDLRRCFVFLLFYSPVTSALWSWNVERSVNQNCVLVSRSEMEEREWDGRKARGVNVLPCRQSRYLLQSK